MKVAITGATDFVGSHLETRLTGEGHKVARITRRDLNDVDQLTAAFADCKVVGHCAGDGLITSSKPSITES